MDYFENQTLLKSCYRSEAHEIAIPGSKSRIVNCDFQSAIKPDEQSGEKKRINLSDHTDILQRTFDGNYNFTYPVFIDQTGNASNGAIILLHGLNERSWHKYLYWAQYLHEHTGKAVILFPIAFHVNRAPGYWSDPRQMSEVAQYRTSQSNQNAVVSPVNAALSTRLDMHPEWFCTSGLQSCYDLIKLIQTIKSGQHPLFHAGTSIDFFAYSIGAFLLEVLLIANPDKMFSESKSFLFSGGSSFQQMQGVSKYIMDAKAFDRLKDTFIRQDPDQVMPRLNMEHLTNFNSLWSSFLAMLRLDRFQMFRDRAFHQMRNQITAIGLLKDQVIPAKSILQTLCGNKNRNKIPMLVLDFPYPYTHENPFPMGKIELRPLVDQAFIQIFGRASEFLA